MKWMHDAPKNRNQWLANVYDSMQYFAKDRDFTATEWLCGVPEEIKDLQKQYRKYTNSVWAFYEFSDRLQRVFKNLVARGQLSRCKIGNKYIYKIKNPIKPIAKFAVAAYPDLPDLALRQQLRELRSPILYNSFSSMGVKLTELEKQYLEDRISDLLKTFRFQNWDEINPTFDHLIKCLDTCRTACNVARYSKKLRDKLLQADLNMSLEDLEKLLG